MHTPQTGILELGTASHSYMEFRLRPGADSVALVRTVADLRGPRETTAGVNMVSGFAPSLWRRLGGHLPDQVDDFDRPVVGPDGFTMPATQQDLWLWVAGHAYDDVFDMSREAIHALAPLANVADEVVGWTYRDSRDLTGFIDGTENPALAEAVEVAIIRPGTAGTGGSIVLVQKWTHRVGEWEALSVEEQEMVMGRTKADSAELPDYVLPPTSHVSRMVLEEEGHELEIFRRNTPFGSAVEHGTMFVGFSAEQHRLHRMLERMSGVGDGVRDALTHYATPLTGAYYFVPNIEAPRVCHHRTGWQLADLPLRISPWVVDQAGPRRQRSLGELPGHGSLGGSVVCAGQGWLSQDRRQMPLSLLFAEQAAGNLTVSPGPAPRLQRNSDRQLWLILAIAGMIRRAPSGG